ncbi:hypothetical protein [Bradyrhizobium sp. Ai1a-2]|uniref:hypothetical protein n=1 Tax=Bradyrhizobium sp. Ai1a-2 TaxID=196490 RepID=UPI00040FF072|nr:hypothetical protein [Bradyrhizobium sp. Ai1a-2]
MSFELRADDAADSGFRLTVTAAGCTGLSADIGVAVLRRHWGPVSKAPSATA